MTSAPGKKNDRLLNRIVAALERRPDGATVPQIALAWIAAHGAVPIPGSRKPNRVDENAAAADIRLSDADVQALSDAIPAADVVGNRSRTPVVPGEDR